MVNEGAQYSSNRCIMGNDYIKLMNYLEAMGVTTPQFDWKLRVAINCIVINNKISLALSTAHPHVSAPCCFPIDFLVLSTLFPFRVLAWAIGKGTAAICSWTLPSLLKTALGLHAIKNDWTFNSLHTRLVAGGVHSFNGQRWCVRLNIYTSKCIRNMYCSFVLDKKYHLACPCPPSHPEFLPPDKLGYTG